MGAFEHEVGVRVYHYEDRIAELEAALKQIRDHDFERVPDETFAQDIEECPDCARCRQREWPPSRLCDEHYRRMSRRGDIESRRRCEQHYAMREIAREALREQS